MTLLVQDGFPVGPKRLEVDVLDGAGELVAAVELAAALGFADEDPVRAAVGGAVEARGFAEGFEQDGADGVASAPVVGQASFDLGEEVRGEVGDGVSRAGSGSGRC